MTVLSVIVSILGTLATIGVGYGMVYLAKSVRRRWKEIDRERLNGLGRGWAWAGLENKLLLPLAKLFGMNPQRHDEQGEFLVEEARDNEETRPLLD